MKIPVHTLVLAASALLAVRADSVSAQDYKSATLPPIWSAVETQIGIGAMWGKSQELVYVAPGSGTLLSKLDWTFDGVAMFNTQTTIKLLPWLKLGWRGAFNITGSSTMDDYDFNLLGCPPPDFNCHSNHPDTRLRQARQLELFGALDVIRRTGFTLSALAGYKHDFYRWNAIGGTANYFPVPFVGNGISYEQTWETPFVGLAVAMQHGPWTLSGRVIGSWWATGEGRDNHHYRSLLFVDKVERTDMVAADVGVAYQVSPQVSITADYKYQRWGTGRGDTTATDLLLGGSAVFVDSAGANQESHMLSLGLKVALQRPHETVGSIKDGPIAMPPQWSGWHIGVLGGFDWQRADWRTTSLASGLVTPDASSASLPFDDDGQRVGLFAGYGWQHGSMIWGIEGEIGYSNASAMQLGIPGTAASAILPGLVDATTVTSGLDGSVRLRVGALLAPWLQIYATGGVAIGQVEAALSCPGDIAFPSWCLTGSYYEEARKVLVGWTAGVGYESQFAGGWFTRGEYRYTDLGSFTHTFIGGAPLDSVAAKIDHASHRLTFGLGYRY
ncbi:MAG: omptin family outer membrane protease [Hyphomicrobiaceae bacterium]